MDLDKVNMLTRREIEARIAAPLIEAFIKELGEEKTLSIAKDVIVSLARAGGAYFAQLAGGNTLKHFGKTCIFLRGLSRGSLKGKFENRRFSSMLCRWK